MMNYLCYANSSITANLSLHVTHHFKPLKMLDQNLDNSYFIEYSNYFYFDGRTFSFRKQELFDITNVPIHIPLKDNNQRKGYWINRKWLSQSRIKDMIIREPKVIDVSSLQWNIQLNLDYVFNSKP